MVCVAVCFLTVCTSSASPAHTGSSISSHQDTRELITWLLSRERSLSHVPFSEVIESATGHKVLAVSPQDEGDHRLLAAIHAAMQQVLLQIQSPDHPIHRVSRINEVSGHLEEIILTELNHRDGVRCSIPRNADGNRQRSGYPDMRLVDASSGRVFYLDPKLYHQDSESSSFRTFYYEPQTNTNKILDDASHLVIGITHNGRRDGRWDVTGWKLVDLHDFQVRLKAEFQASNRDLYRKEAILFEENLSTTMTGTPHE